MSPPRALPSLQKYFFFFFYHILQSERLNVHLSRNDWCTADQRVWAHQKKRQLQHAGDDIDPKTTGRCWVAHSLNFIHNAWNTNFNQTIWGMVDSTQFNHLTRVVFCSVFKLIPYSAPWITSAPLTLLGFFPLYFTLQESRSDRACVTVKLTENDNKHCCFVNHTLFPNCAKKSIDIIQDPV